MGIDVGVRVLLGRVISIGLRVLNSAVGANTLAEPESIFRPQFD